MYAVYIVFTLLSILILSIVPFLRRYLRRWQLSQNFAGPPPLPIVGNANLFIGCRAEDAFNIVRDIMLQYGDTIKIWFGFEFSLFMANTRDVESILGTTNWLVKSYEYGYLKNWLCEGLLISRPAKWFKRRRILTPAFHFKILEQFVEIFDRNSRVLANNVGDKAGLDGEGVINMGHLISLATLDVICGK